MRKNIAKSLTVGFLAIIMVLTGFVSLASAKTVKTKTVRVKTVHAKTVKTKTVKVHKRTITGKLSGSAGSTFTMTKGSKAYTVSFGSASFVDRHGKSIGPSAMSSGDKLSVTGTVSGTSITATKVRDLSVGTKKTK